MRQRIEAVLDYAATIEGRDTANPARWRGYLANLLPAPSKVRRVQHLAAMDWRDLPDFWKDLKQREGVSPVALVFVILTAARFGEARLMQKREVDSQQLIWTVPAERMKAEKEHRVPLAKEVLELPGDMVDDDALAFLSTSRRNRPLSDMSLTALLKRMGRDDITVYGFRSIFRDWAGETTGHLREVIEHSFAQQAKDKAESAYAHGDSFIKRRRLMEDWARYLTSAMVQDAEGPNVVALSTQAAS